MYASGGGLYTHIHHTVVRCMYSSKRTVQYTEMSDKISGRLVLFKHRLVLY